MAYLKFLLAAGVALLTWLSLPLTDKTRPEDTRLLIGLEAPSLSHAELQACADRLLAPALSGLGKMTRATGTINGRNAVFLQVTQGRHRARHLMRGMGKRLPASARLRVVSNRPTIAVRVTTPPHWSAARRQRTLNRVQQKLLGELAVEMIVANINQDTSRLYITLKDRHPPILQVLERLRDNTAAIPDTRLGFSYVIPNVLAEYLDGTGVAESSDPVHA